MRNLFCILIITFGLKSYSGCGGLYLRVNTIDGITYYNTGTYGSIMSTTVSGVDSLEIKVYSLGQWHCTLAQDLFILRDSDTLIKIPSFYATNTIFKVLGLPGRYKVTCNWVYNAILFPHVWEFDLIYTPSDTLATAIPVVTASDLNFFFYPNPATDVLFIESAAEPIKELQVFTSTGKLYFSQAANSSNMSIPVESWPRGIYLVKVATLSEKVTMKKLLLE